MGSGSSGFRRCVIIMIMIMIIIIFITNHNLTLIELACVCLYVCSRFPPRRLAPRAPNFQELFYDLTNETKYPAYQGFLLVFMVNQMFAT